MNDTRKEISAELDVLKHVDTLIGNATLGQKSVLRREGIRLAQKIVREQIDIRFNALWSKEEPHA